MKQDERLKTHWWDLRLSAHEPRITKGRGGKNENNKCFLVFSSLSKTRGFLFSFRNVSFLILLLSIYERALSQALPTDLKLSVFVRVPKNTANPALGLEVVDASTVAIDSYLLAPGFSSPSATAVDQLCVLAKRQQEVSIVSGSLNLSMGTGIGSDSVGACSGVYCGVGSSPVTYVLSSLTGSKAQEKWLHALYGGGSLSLSNIEAFSGSSFTGTLQTGVSCNVNSTERYWGVRFSVNNKAGQSVPLSFLVKLGAAPYAGIAAQVAPGAITTSSLQNI